MEQRCGHDIYETLDADHGRIEVRKYIILPAVEYLMEENLQAWKNQGTTILVETKHEVQGKVTQETRIISEMRKRIMQPTFAHLSGGIGILKTNYIGIRI